MKNQLTILWAIIVIALFFSCGPGAEEKSIRETVRQDSLAAPQAEKKVNYEDKAKKFEMGEKLLLAPPVKVIEDKLSPVPPLVTRETEGTLVYYCPVRMLENSHNNISVTITKAALLEAVDQLKRRVEATSLKSAESIKEGISGSHITIAAKMKVELKYSDGDFGIIYQPENADQIFDGIHDMNWDWIVEPLKIGTIQLSIIVSAFDEKNGRWVASQSPPKIFSIKVQVDPRGYFAKLWEFLLKNPEWLFIQILFPIIAFFFGRRQGKKSS